MTKRVEEAETALRLAQIEEKKEKFSSQRASAGECPYYCGHFDPLSFWVGLGAGASLFGFLAWAAKGG